MEKYTKQKVFKIFIKDLLDTLYYVSKTPKINWYTNTRLEKIALVLRTAIKNIKLIKR